MARITNRQAREYVEHRRQFMTNNETLYGINCANGVYAAYSYGTHFPIYAYVNGQWYENSGRYSVTTSRHQSYARPWHAELIKVDTATLQRLIAHNVQPRTESEL